ncbi:GNAT family N-acetyltransferase [Candidatus Woesearchaeota archaeon]|nr:GNAT family N-acetyltransferase [Candidatus Woesearchaeota archaeon]
MEIRLADEAYFDELCRMRKELLIERGQSEKVATSDNNIKVYLSRDYSRFYIAFEDGKAAGYVHGTIDPEPQEHIQAYIQDVYVMKEYRRRGIGTKLLEKMHKHFKDNGVRPGMTTDKSNLCSISLHRKQGYEIVKESKDSNGKEVVYMVKEK